MVTKETEPEFATLGVVFRWLIYGAIWMGVVGIASANLGRWVGSIISNTEFSWTLPSSEWVAWVGGVGLLVWSGAAGINAQRVWAHDGAWSPRVLGNVVVCGVGVVVSLLWLGTLIALGVNPL
jgi:hypothetical protein